ncbi:hypothetical protein M0R45_009698 [Rubus argutus]|uniref:Uncharacterized protein n=1 Tax=Rubus argutus TaxID=59490 RepID=A0AAW1Y4E9_RUBAR
MENQQQQSSPGSAKLNRTTSMESEPKTLTKEQYDLAIRAAAAMQAFEQRNNETTVTSNGCGRKLPA